MKKIIRFHQTIFRHGIAQTNLAPPIWPNKMITLLLLVFAFQYPASGQDSTFMKTQEEQELRARFERDLREAGLPTTAGRLWVGSEAQEVLNSMGFSTPKSDFNAIDFEYMPVEGFSLDDNFVRWEPYSASGPSSIIHAEGDDFFCLITISHHVKRFDSRVPFETKEGRNIFYFNRIRDDLIDIAGKYGENRREDFSQKDLEKSVRFLSKRKALKKFNADMVATYTLPVVEANYIIEQKGKDYIHCDVLMLHKNDLGPVFLYRFYTDEGYKNRKNYRNKLEKAVGFKK